MKKLIFMMTMIAFAMIAVTVPAMAADVVAPSPATGFVGWVMANTTAIVVVLLAVSEFLALIPGLSGNGILDSIIRILKSMAGKSE